MTRSKLCLSGLGLALLAGCASAPPLAQFEAQGPAPKAAMVLAIGAEKDGVSQLRIRGGALQSSLVRGEARREGEGWELSLSSLEWFSNWANGWTQGRFLLDGSASIRPTAAGWVLAVERAPQLDTVDSASIRYFDTFVRGARGQAEFSRRWDRIQAVAKEVLTALSARELAADPRLLRRYLFPEIYGYDSPPQRGHARVLVQGFAWDSDYTARRFSEPLRVLRDSGSLLRDYKESPGLWYLALGWKELWDSGGEVLILRRDK